MTDSSTQAPSKLDMIIRGGTVIDGTKAPRFDADVGIVDGKIAFIGDLSTHEAATVIDATGKVVTPGFIDSHTHDDQAVLTLPDMSFKVSQGVTTVVAGNCGISLAPLAPDTPLPAPLNLLESREGDGSRFETFASYMDAVRATPSSVNVAAMVGHTTLRSRTMSDLGRAANAVEVAHMQALVKEALAAGAVGLSTGTYYPPAFHATTEELIEVCRPLTGSGALYVTHMRDESDQVMDSLEEVFRIGSELDIPVVISHHKTSGAANFGRMAETLPRIKRAMECQCVALDCYPYNAGSTMLRTDRGMADNRILISSSEPHPEMVGRDLIDIAGEWSLSLDDAAARLQPASAIYFMMDENDVQSVLKFDETMVGSDGIPVGEKPHPRLWGTFPRVLGHYCRDLSLFPLETAVWKMTGLTARNFGLDGRGTLAIGQHADVVIFDAATIRDAADYVNPTQPAEGIDTVIVNGHVTWQHGAHSGARGGQVVTRSPAGAYRAFPAMAA
ncbi:MAG: D-aminoacylase [Rhizobacter sp.]|nr:D-aminoacylase [Rhizobacter sp.]